MATEQVADFDFGAGKKDLPDVSVAPDGPYNLKITKAEMKQSKGGAGKPQRPMIAITTVIDGGPYATLPVWHNFVYTEENLNAKRMFYNQLALLGIVNPGTGAQVCAQLVGRVFNANVGHRDYNGTPQNTIERLNSLVSAGDGMPSATPAAAPVAAPIPQPAQAPAIPDVTPQAVVPQPAPAPQPETGVVKPPF